MADGGDGSAPAAEVPEVGAGGAGGEGGADAHPTASAWTLYELRERVVRKDESGETVFKEDYLHRHLPVFTCASLEEFWRNFVHIPAISDVFSNGVPKGREPLSDKPKVLRPDEDTGDERKSHVEAYCFFKSGIEPTEEAKTASGEPITKVQLHYRCSREVDKKAKYDKAWETIVMGMLGETFDDADYINGARIVDKTKDKRAIIRFEIWLNTDNSAVYMKIAEAVEEAVKAETGLRIELRAQKKRK